MYDHTNYADIPERILNAFDRHGREGLPTGSFCNAVLENNLLMAVNAADPHSRAHLRAIVNYVYNELPPECWGTPEKVKQWQKEAACSTS
jgi:hypothetical protein